MQAVLPGSGPVQPSIYPRFAQDLDTLGQTTGKVPQFLAARADAYALQSSVATRGLARIEVTAIVPDQFTGLRTDLEKVRSLMAQSLRQYRAAATLMQRAIAANGTKRTTLVSRATRVERQARSVYADGYNDLVAVWGTVGIPVPSPRPTPSPKASASPSKTPPPTHAPSPKSSTQPPSPKPTHTGGSNCVGNICFTTPPTPSIGVP
jgi:hypothetical protein